MVERTDYQLLKLEFDSMQRQVEALMEADVKIRRDFRQHEAQTMKVIEEHTREIAALTAEQAEISKRLNAFAATLEPIENP